jgi:diguanylate cyclase (GGDEF)-like protein/PAS domain S-box-containing protein/putative nucleotidyltransferase with HDIG domain
MRILSTSTSIAIGFGCIIVSAVLGAHMAGLLPDRAGAITEQRLQLAQVLDAQCSDAADRNDAQTIRALLNALIANNPDVASAGVRSPGGKLVIEVGPHAATWKPIKESDPASFETEVPILQNGKKWASLEIRFVTLPDSGFFTNPLFRMTCFIGAGGFIGSLLFLRKALKHLDPSSVIPDRVRAMLDALAEGVIVMDNSEQIVMANESFCRITNSTLAQIQGRKVSQLPSLVGDHHKGHATNAAWIKALTSVEPVRRMTVRLASPDGAERSLVLNAVPVLGNDGSRRGVLATFDDVTSIEATNAQLRDTLGELAKSRDEIARQNKELEALASRDPLTGCFNRRAFMRSFEEFWAKASSTGKPLGCIMLDIDHFKMVNDRYGHGVGDQVLKQMGQVLHGSCRTQDLVCRYGGEEFCVLLPGAGFEEAHEAAERLRAAILANTWPITTVTSSIGVTGIEAGAPDARSLIEQADKALYAAKRTGRNRVVPWGDPAIEATATQKPEERREASSLMQAKQVAHALIETLARRDKATADHSRRVADLACLIVGSSNDAEQVEFTRLAGLLHDVGKIAIPDAILHKPGRLTEEEWLIMHRHESMGADLVQEAIGNARLTEIIRTHHSWYAGREDHPEMPKGENIPLAGRCILIADAYDAMVSDRPYRKGMPHKDACAELMRCGGTQFDPDLVRKFVAILDERQEQPADQAEKSLTALASAVEEIQAVADSVETGGLKAGSPATQRA